MDRSYLIVILLIVLLIGALTISKKNVSADSFLVFCCNNNFPSSSQPPNGEAHMNCHNTEYDITMETCARYYSVYLEMYETNPTEMCQFLPGTPPLPDVPIPGSFNVYITDEDHPEIAWTHYYVHEYRIERKIGSGYWSNIVTIFDEEEQTYIDEAITVPDPKGRTIYYRMRGKVYDTYSDYTDEKIPAENQKRVLPKRLADDNTNTEPLPQNFELLSNYPNPFNSTTAIRFQLPYETYVTLKIFNLRGEDIRTLASGTMKPGMQQVAWDGTDQAGRKVATGIYICQIIAGEFKQTQKMTLAY